MSSTSDKVMFAVAVLMIVALISGSLFAIANVIQKENKLSAMINQKFIIGGVSYTCIDHRNKDGVLFVTDGGKTLILSFQAAWRIADESKIEP